jgi:P2 family phage contractile tail tube protein
MGSLIISKVQDANVYINGTSTHGQASEVTLPEIQYAKGEYKALGLIGTPAFFNGVEKLEATIKWNYPENEVQIACANPRKSVDLMVRSNKQIYKDGTISDEQPVVVYLRGTSNNHGTGAYKAKEDTDLQTKLDITYIKEEVNGQEIIEIDVLNNIFRIAGEDQLAKYRDNLGI